MFLTQSIALPLDKTRLSIFLTWLVTVSGLIGIFIGFNDWFLPKTPFNLLLGTGLLLWNFPLKNGWRSLAVWSLAYGIGFGVEVAGVSTGLLFGEYHYGDNLGPKLFGVPLIIGINWVVLTFTTLQISQRLLHNKWAACLLGAVLMVALDVFIEPVAPIFDFWHWKAGEAPLQNFIAWFFVAFLLQILTFKEAQDQKHPLPMHHFAAQVLFFAFFYATYHL